MRFESGLETENALQNELMSKVRKYDEAQQIEISDKIS